MVQFATSTSSSNDGKKCSELQNLVFCDDFDGATGTAPDNSKWNILTYSAWGGQCFKDDRQNIAQDGSGNLKLTLINTGSSKCTTKEGYLTNVTSGAMDTYKRQYFHYGRFEIRAKLSCAKSVWGAFWTANGSGEDRWPETGEIDMYELFKEPNVLTQSIHGGTFQPKSEWQILTDYTTPDKRPLCENYHVYGMEWRQGYVQFMLDGQNTNRISKSDAGNKPWPFDTYDQRIIISHQYGGEEYDSLVGSYDLRELPSSTFIDYIRVYK